MVPGLQTVESAANVQVTVVGTIYMAYSLCHASDKYRSFLIFVKLNSSRVRLRSVRLPSRGHQNLVYSRTIQPYGVKHTSNKNTLNHVPTRVLLHQASALCSCPPTKSSSSSFQKLANSCFKK
jgi:hypothetical protein